MKQFRLTVVLCALAISTASCVWTAQRVAIQAVAPGEVTTISNPVKAHLEDGTTVVYPNGVNVVGQTLRGAGTQYDLTLTQSSAVTAIPLESVIGMESFRTETDVAETVVVSTLATAGAIVGAAALAVAIFGSCPTVYSNDGIVEEAELFSSSIAPLFEARDLDLLRAQSDPGGTLTLEVRNEAMETHYINHLQVVEITHKFGEVVLPNPQGRPLIVGDVTVPESMTDSTGKDVLGILAAADDAFYKADRDMIENATLQEMNDWIDVDAMIPEGSVEIGIVLRLRNSLLSTVLLYNEMLEPMGAAGLDWLGGDLSEISTAVELGRWHQQRAGLHVEILTNGDYKEITRIPDSGPISWHDLVVVVPVDPDQRSLSLRLRFLTDYWRIDRVNIASRIRDANPTPIEVSKVTGPTGGVEIEALERLRDPDKEYLQTNPGERFFAHFDVGNIGSDQTRSFLLSSQGYYIEWIRGEWIRNASTGVTFEPNDAVLLDALQKWSSVREDFEARFQRDRVPVQ